jgi:hypothetical protein
MIIGMYVYIILIKIRMILNYEMCLRSVQKVGVEEGGDGLVTLATDVLSADGSETFPKHIMQGTYPVIFQSLSAVSSVQAFSGAHDTLGGATGRLKRLYSFLRSLQRLYVISI